jgi:hypothetical protein
MGPRAYLVWVVLALLPVACGGRTSYKLAPVSGRVKLDNLPLADARVEFMPTADAADDNSLPSSVGTTGEDGRFTLVLGTDGKTAGAVVGKHKVRILLGMGSSKDVRPTFHRQLLPKYNRQTELECDVPADGRDDADFDLKSR